MGQDVDVPSDDRSVLTRPAPEPDVIAAWGPGAEDVAEVQLGGDDQPLVIVVHGDDERDRKSTRLNSSH